jgi:protein TonB
MHVSRFSQFNLLLLIALLHLTGMWGIWRAQVALTPPVAPQQQVITAMLIAPDPKPEPPPPKPEPVKPVVKPPKPVKLKPALKPTPERAITEKTVRLNTPLPEVEAKPVPVKTAPALPQKMAVSAAKTAQSHPQTAPVKTTTPQFNAAYLNNPAPEYPSSARRMGEMGRVILRVQVTANGSPSQVLIHSSSGVDSLDEAALEAVQRWKFVPAKQGETPVMAWVNVPIQFTLN